MVEQDFSAAALSPAMAGAERRRSPIEFTGTGGEYFRIWIVNLLLTIVTLGIYSAWAKVRKMQYFYRNTRVDGAVFDYHGRPVAILKGRLIAVALLVAYNLAFQFSLMLGLVTVAVLAAAMPWLLAQSQRFRLHNSSYRGLRFRFLGSTKEAYIIFGIPILVLFGAMGWFSTIGAQAEQGIVPDWSSLIVPGLAYLAVLVLWPYLHFLFKRYQHANSAYGATTSGFSGEASRFYAYYGLVLLILVITGVVLFGVPAMLRARGAFGGFVIIAAVVLFYVVLLGIGPYLGARVQNYVWTNTRLGSIRFDSAVGARRLAWIVISNLILIALTLGLFIPFAAVRVAKYKLESMAVLGDDLAKFAGTSAAEIGTLGEGAADVFDVDFAL